MALFCKHSTFSIKNTLLLLPYLDQLIVLQLQLTELLLQAAGCPHVL